MKRELAMVAGEASGDLLASLLLQGLHTYLPADIEYAGIGGARMMAQGFRSDWPMETLSVSGYVEVLRHLREILAVRSGLKQRLLNTPPLAFVGVDAPDFNFHVELALRAAGVPVVHFVSPSIWAWRGGRIHTIKRAVDHMLCLFPFEPDIYRRAGVPATYVGHPLADVIPMVPDVAGARAALNMKGNVPIVAVLPGSRRGEVSRLAPVFFAAMRDMLRCDPTIRFVMPLASPGLQTYLQPLLENYPDLPLTVTDGKSHLAMEAADVILLASGTATLEAALYKKPMVISYKVHWLTAQIMKRQGYLPYVGLPNILSNQFVVPELLQDAATPQALSRAVMEQLSDVARRTWLQAHFTSLHHLLKRDTPSIAGEVVHQVLSQHGRL